MAEKFKMEAGSKFPAWCFLDPVDPNTPSSWGLRTHEIIHGEYKITKRQLDRATAALLSPGYMGNRSHKLSHGRSYPKLQHAMIDSYRTIGIRDHNIPAGLWPNSVAPAMPLEGLSLAPPKPRYANFNALEHYGVKGMRWGIRKDHEQARRAKASDLNDNDLRTAVKRMNLERNYNDLISKEKKATANRATRGKQAVEKAIKDAGQEQLKNLVSRAIGVGISVTVDQAANRVGQRYNLSEEHLETIKKLGGSKK